MSDYHLAIGFIGAGNMTRCFVSGLVTNHYPANHLWASNPSQEKLAYLKQQFNIHTTMDNQIVAKQASIIVLAVKPSMMLTVTQEIRDIVQQQHPLIISIAAGITEPKLREWLGDEVAIIRCMPNIPAFVNNGATGMFANAYVSHLQRDLAEAIFRAVGTTLWVNDESLMDTIAALSGSGPAYFYVVMEALENAAVELGLTRDDAHLLTVQTALGAAQLALTTNENIIDLRQRVTSKGGITEQALAVLESHAIKDTFAEALRAAYNRAKEIAQS
jgi:pyrroline-5-carboxylate reductase